MRTSGMAKLFAVHPNTVRLYEDWGYLPPIPRDQSGQRTFTEKHVEQMRLARCALHNAPRSGPEFKAVYKELVWLACADRVSQAIAQARKHLVTITSAYERANDAVTFLQTALPDHISQRVTPPFTIQQAASFIGISVPILRRWEFYDVIQAPRSAKNNYRIYGANEIGWLLVIQSLRQAGHTLDSIHQLIHPPQKDSHPTASDDLCNALMACLGLFLEHENHTNKVLDQLCRMEANSVSH